MCGQIGNQSVTFGSGTFFGDQYLMFKEVESGFLMTSESSVIFVLSKDSFQEVIDNYPRLKGKYDNEVVRRGKYIQKAKNSTGYLGLLQIDVNRERLRYRGIFNSCEISFVHQLASIIQCETVLDGDVCITEGQTVNAGVFLDKKKCRCFC